jgi:hypothetical protein
LLGVELFASRLVDLIKHAGAILEVDFMSFVPTGYQVSQLKQR